MVVLQRTLALDVATGQVLLPLAQPETTYIYLRDRLLGVGIRLSAQLLQP